MELEKDSIGGDGDVGVVTHEHRRKRGGIGHGHDFGNV